MNKDKKMGFWQVVGSTFAAAFGVQSRKNQERDFAKGRMTTFIISGLVFTALFAGTVLLIVQLVLQQAK